MAEGTGRVGTTIVKVIAHRGRHSTYRENSREAVIAAYNSNADGVEVDLRQLGDGHIILHHDGVVTPAGETTVDARYHDLRSLTLDEVEARLGERPMTLPEALDTRPENKDLILECKPHRHTTGFCRALVDQLPDTPLERVRLSSESWSILRELRLRTDYPLAPVVRQTRGLNRGFLRRNWFDEVHLRWNLAMDEELLRVFRERSLPVITWTVNDPSVRDQLEQLGIDGIMTDNETLYPEL